MRHRLASLRYTLLLLSFLAVLVSCDSNSKPVASEVMSAPSGEEASTKPNDLESIRKSAENGSASSQFDLGFMYHTGRGVQEDFKQTLYWYTKAAEQGYGRAQCGLGVMYDEGQGVPKDLKQALNWHTKAAEQGVLFSQNALFKFYYFGDQKDFKQAYHWVKKAAEQGDPDAQFMTGYVYSQGQGVTQDYKQTVYWYTKAAEQGKKSAQHKLGIGYLLGYGVPQDYKQAYAWLSIAAMDGDKEIAENRNQAANKLTPQGLEEAQALSSDLQKKIESKAKGK